MCGPASSIPCFGPAPFLPCPPLAPFPEAIKKSEQTFPMSQAKAELLIHGHHHRMPRQNMGHFHQVCAHAPGGHFALKHHRQLSPQSALHGVHFEFSTQHSTSTVLARSRQVGTLVARGCATPDMQRRAAYLRHAQSVVMTTLSDPP